MTGQDGLLRVQSRGKKLISVLSAGEGDPGADPGSNQRAGWTDSEGKPHPHRRNQPVISEQVLIEPVSVLCAGAARSGRLHERPVSRLHRRNQCGRGHQEAGLWSACGGGDTWTGVW